MPDKKCETCRAPTRKGIFPQQVEDYPDSWQPIHSLAQFNCAKWLPQQTMDKVRYCHACGTLWYLSWDPKAQLLNALITLNKKKAKL